MARSKPMTYDDVADLYQRKTGSSARVKPMGKVMDWLEKQPEVEYDEKKDLFFLKGKGDGKK